MEISSKPDKRVIRDCLSLVLENSLRLRGCISQNEWESTLVLSGNALSVICDIKILGGVPKSLAMVECGVIS